MLQDKFYLHRLHSPKDTRELGPDFEEVLHILMFCYTSNIIKVDLNSPSLRHSKQSSLSALNGAPHKVFSYALLNKRKIDLTSTNDIFTHSSMFAVLLKQRFLAAHK